MLIKDVKFYLYVGVLNDVLHPKSVMRIFNEFACLHEEGEDSR